MSNTNFENSSVEFNMSNVRVGKAPVIKQNSDGSHRVMLMVVAGENKCYFLQDYVKAGVDPATTRLATRVVGEALNVSGYLDGHVYQTQNGQSGYALSCNVTRVIYLTSKEQREALVAKRAAAAQNVPQALQEAQAQVSQSNPVAPQAPVQQAVPVAPQMTQQTVMQQSAAVPQVA